MSEEPELTEEMAEQIRANTKRITEESKRPRYEQPSYEDITKPTEEPKRCSCGKEATSSVGNSSTPFCEDCYHDVSQAFIDLYKMGLLK